MDWIEWIMSLVLVGSSIGLAFSSSPLTRTDVFGIGFAVIITWVLIIGKRSLWR